MAGKIQIITDELVNDPNVRDYVGMADNQAIIADLNAETIQVNKDTLHNKEILEAIDATEFTAITGDDLTKVMGILAVDSVDPFGIAADIFIAAFPEAGTTLTSLDALRVKNISRAYQLGLPVVKEGWVEQARAKGGI